MAYSLTMGMMVEKKKWGWKVNIVDKAEYRLDICEAKKGESSSLHFHEHKNNTITVLIGVLKILIVSDDGDRDEIELTAGESIILHAERIHQFTALTDCQFSEVDWCSDGSRPSEDDIRRLETAEVG